MSRIRNAILPKGAAKITNREIGVPGVPGFKRLRMADQAINQRHTGWQCLVAIGFEPTKAKLGQLVAGIQIVRNSALLDDSGPNLECTQRALQSVQKRPIL